MKGFLNRLMVKPYAKNNWRKRVAGLCSLILALALSIPCNAIAEWEGFHHFTDDTEVELLELDRCQYRVKFVKAGNEIVYYYPSRFQTLDTGSRINQYVRFPLRFHDFRDFESVGVINRDTLNSIFDDFNGNTGTAQSPSLTAYFSTLGVARMQIAFDGIADGQVVSKNFPLLDEGSFTLERLCGPVVVCSEASLIAASSIVASQSYSSYYEGSNLADGSSSTRWYTPYNVNSATLDITLEAAVFISELQLIPTFDSYNASDVTIYVSEDGANFIEASAASSDNLLFSFTEKMVAQHIRIELANSTGAYISYADLITKGCETE